MSVTKKMKLSNINFDETLMVREINNYYVARYSEAMRAGAIFPPLVIDAKTKCLVCGFHRYRSYESVFGLSYEIEVIEKNYKDFNEKFLDAITDNQRNGQPLYVKDIRRALFRGKDIGISMQILCQALSITEDKAVKYLSENVIVLKANGTKKVIPAKANTGIISNTIVSEKVAENIQTKYVDKTVCLIANQLIMRLNDNTFDVESDKKTLILLADLIYKKVGKK